MKKTITTLLILFLTFGLFAETGYKNHQWYSNTRDFPNYGRIEFKEKPSVGLVWPYIYSAEIQGTMTNIYYCFSGIPEENQVPEFIAAGFFLPNKNAKEYAKKITQGKTSAGTLEIYNYEYEGLELEDDVPVEIRDFFYLAEFQNMAHCIEELGLEEMKTEALKNKKAKNIISTISIYNYNDDTRCYIFENFAPGRTAILFGPHANY